ncbi:WD40 repeat-like protein [Microstroma glucosiphilum]|uniref:Pre-mRNA-splicing factor PRP46 n=1 Tax=Pseudomicrostroma glucosiphilum TaxID=1684307 RepID=A0A316UF27_9BASI|nr:WD40 repeat-like protein [Pseudomicrostroma glucosiphilum]PWN21735.1 WD40 repeat-like protein [Pseudomicrostroma glucosiphilum]
MAAEIHPHVNGSASTAAEASSSTGVSLPSLSSLLASSASRTQSLFASSSSPFSAITSTSRSSAFEESSKAHLASKIVGEYGDATILHPAIQSQQLNQAGPGRPAKGKGRDDGTAGSNTLESEWIEDIEKKRGANGATAGPSVAPPPSANGGALIKHSDQKLPPPGEYDRSSSLSMALQLKRRQLDNVAKPEVYHPRWKLSRVIAGHLGWVRAIAVDPGNQWFATGAGDRMIKIWDLASGELKLSLTGHISAVRGLAVSDRHPYLFSCGEDKMVKCWDLEQNKVIRQYHGHLSGIYSLALHPTLDVLVTAGRDASARVWDMRTRAQVHVLSGHTGTVASVQCQDSDPQVITGSMDSTVRLWDLAAGKSMTTLTHHKKSVRAIATHPTKFSFASGSAGGNNIKTWVCPEGTLFGNMAHETIVNTMSVNADGVLFSGGDNGSMKFFDYTSGIPFQTLDDTPQPGSLDAESGIMASTFDRTGTRLLTGCCDKSIKVWKEES